VAHMMTKTLFLWWRWPIYWHIN